MGGTLLEMMNLDIVYLFCSLIDVKGLKFHLLVLFYLAFLEIKLFVLPKLLSEQGVDGFGFEE